MKKKDLIKKIAKLETINDQLVAEIEYVDLLARQIGFEEGLKTLKSAALEILEEEDIEEPPFAI
ncbi:MAG: hypothetical protein KR126chlam4_00482 [Candidatus Anoxychlamydiales bacterium]|nr:hypothetical protein [Candidatus Anoxychlamydiales bacterium]NGX40654.1 hypothetical protein [Candidatus Anoxychlamydiales bacterium]